MKILFFVLVCIFLSFNVFAIDFEGNWVANFEIINEDDEIEEKEIEISFYDGESIFYRENSQDVYNYEIDENFFFLVGAGYEVETENEDRFVLIPRHGTNINIITFVRQEDE